VLDEVQPEWCEDGNGRRGCDGEPGQQSPPLLPIGAPERQGTPGQGYERQEAGSDVAVERQTQEDARGDEPVPPPQTPADGQEEHSSPTQQRQPLDADAVTTHVQVPRQRYLYESG